MSRLAVRMLKYMQNLQNNGLEFNMFSFTSKVKAYMLQQCWGEINLQNRT